MRLTGSRVYTRPAPVPKMPPGLVELMEGLTKDVLKHNPPEVYEFCAEHMRKLLEIRDGPTSQKPLSLDQKISRAQEKVRKRAEQRRQKFENERNVQAKVDKSNERQISEETSAVVDNNTVPTTIKPIHNDLTQDSEIEISCEPNTRTDQPNSNAIPDIEQTSDPPETNKKEINQTETSNAGNHAFEKEDQTVSVSGDGHNQTAIQPEQKEDSEEEPSVLDSKPLTIEMLIKDEPGDVNIENSKENTHLPSSDIVGSTDDDDQTDIKEEEILDKSETSDNSKLPKVNDASVKGEPDIIQSVSAITLTESNEDDTNSFNESIIKNENDREFFAIQETIENKPDQNITQPIIAESVSCKENETEYIENANSEVGKEKKEGTQSGNDATQSGNDAITEISVVEIPSEIEESTTDLETVMNEAIENTKRKDSSADDSPKDYFIFNDESDASEGSNLVSKAMELNKLASLKESDAIVSIDDKDNKDSKILDNVGDEKISDSLNSYSARPKRSLDENTSKSLDAEKAKIDKDVVELDPKILDSSSSIITQDNNANESHNKAPKNDSSNTMDLETAAVTIQKVFRTFLFKSRASTFDESVTEENNLSDDDDNGNKKDDVFLPANNLNKDRRSLGLSRMDTVLQTVNEEKSLSLSTDESSLSSAATIIQAHVRGFLLRNKLHSGKSEPKNSSGISNERSSTSLDGDTDKSKTKTVLNIHIVPESGNYLSRDESMITSMDLSLDGSPPSSVNLHPLGYNTSERRKQLKREDAIQSVSPPSNNSGKLSEDVDSIKELNTIEQDPNTNQEQKTTEVSLLKDESLQDAEVESLETTPTTSLTSETVVAVEKSSNTELTSSPEPNTGHDKSEHTKKKLTKQSSDEMDVVTPYKENVSIEVTKLIHSGEFHDTVLPTKVSRSDTPVVSEFKNVLVYFLLWNNS